MDRQKRTFAVRGEASLQGLTAAGGAEASLEGSAEPETQEDRGTRGPLSTASDGDSRRSRVA
jgi:hypothetical protein